MGTKLPRKTLPDGHSRDDFQCFGPPATKDGEFRGTMICDMGCFNQSGVDSNKYYHGSVVKSKKNGGYYVYFEFGRTGASSPDFQFVECDSKEDAEEEYCDQLHSKNDKRGVWVNHPSLGRVLQAKPGKDCYLVRPQATRQTGLPDARTITFNEGASVATAVTKSDGDKVAEATDKKKRGTKKAANAPPVASKKYDPETLKLGIDLLGGVTTYTRSSMADAALPTQSAIDRVRSILDEAMQRIQKVGNNVEDQVNDKELKDLTSMTYGLIPKKKALKASAEEWILNAGNIARWQDDLQAFETALYANDLGATVETDPWAGMPLDIRWLSPQSELGKFIREWMPKASLNRHANVGAMRIKNVWEVNRHEETNRLKKFQEKIITNKAAIRERPLNQPTNRIDLTAEEQEIYRSSNTMMGFHGTRTVNCSGILSTGLRMPKALKGVVITGWMFGAGSYWADDWRKSAGYTSLRSSYYASGGGNISGRGAMMFVADVVLGIPYVAPRAHPYTEPPKGHHSVMGKAGVSGVYNNEYITFEKDTHRLRYLVEFEA